jgi:hypothetical protein
MVEVQAAIQNSVYCLLRPARTQEYDVDQAGIKAQPSHHRPAHHPAL